MATLAHLVGEGQSPDTYILRDKTGKTVVADKTRLIRYLESKELVCDNCVVEEGRLMSLKPISMEFEDMADNLSSLTGIDREFTVLQNFKYKTKLCNTDYVLQANIDNTDFELLDTKQNVVYKIVDHNISKLASMISDKLRSDEFGAIVNEARAMSYKVDPIKGVTASVAVIIIDNGAIQSVLCYKHLRARDKLVGIVQLTSEQFKEQLLNHKFTNMDEHGNLIGNPKAIMMTQSEFSQCAVLDVEYIKKLSGTPIQKVIDSRVRKVEADQMLKTPLNLGINGDIEQAVVIRDEVRTTRDKVLMLTSKKVRLVDAIDTTTTNGEANTLILDIYIDNNKITQKVDAQSVINRFNTALEQNRKAYSNFKPTKGDELQPSVVPIESILGDGCTFELKTDYSKKPSRQILNLVKAQSESSGADESNSIIAKIFNEPSFSSQNKRIAYCNAGTYYDTVKDKIGLVLYVFNSKVVNTETHTIRFIALEVK